MLPNLLNGLAKKYEIYRKPTWLVLILSLSGLIATSAMASGPSFILTLLQILFVGAFAQSFFIIGLLYGFRQLHSEQAIMPLWKLGFRIGEWANALIVSVLLPMPVIAIPISIVWYILGKS